MRLFSSACAFNLSLVPTLSIMFVVSFHTELILLLRLITFDDITCLFHQILLCSKKGHQPLRDQAGHTIRFFLVRRRLAQRRWLSYFDHTSWAFPFNHGDLIVRKSNVRVARIFLVWVFILFSHIQFELFNLLVEVFRQRWKFWFLQYWLIVFNFGNLLHTQVWTVVN